MRPSHLWALPCLPALPACLAACRFLPTVILGDLDSLRPDVAAFYTEQGIPVRKDPDQNTTDLTKCILYVQAQGHAPQGLTAGDAAAGGGNLAGSSLPAGGGGQQGEGGPALPHTILALGRWGLGLV